MTMTTASFGKFYWPGINAAYGDAYKMFPIEYTEIFSTHSSDKAYEEDVGLSGFGMAPEKAEGEAVTYDDAQQAFVDRYTNITYALGFVITREMIEDMVGPKVAFTRAQALAHSLRTTKETVAANILNRAFNSSYTYGDGLELCSTAHLNQSGGTWRNELSTAADLSEASIEQAFADLSDMEDDRGLEIPVNARKLVVHPAGLPNATRLLYSKLRPSTSDNDLNWTKHYGMFPEGVVTNHYLTDTDAWFIITDVPHGMKCFERRKEEFERDKDFDTWNSKFVGSFRCAFGCSDKRGIFGSPGA